MKRAVALAALAVLISDQAAWAQTATSTDTDELTTAIRPEEEPGVDWPALILRLPQDWLELAFVPLMPVVIAFERWQLVDRFFDLVTNDAQTVAFVPIVDPLNASGIGVGATLIYNDPLGSNDRLVLVSMIRENRDRQISLSFSRRFPSLSGRTVSLSAGYSADRDQRYFGLGSGTSRANERLIRVDRVEARVGFTLLAPKRLPEYTAGVQLAFRRRRITVGTNVRAPGLAPNDIIEVPAGFGRTLDYPEIVFETEYDSRDSFGRTTKGVIARFAGTATHDLNSGSTGGIRLDGSLAGFFPLLPLYRVLFLSVSAAGTVPLGSDSKVPLHLLANLGGPNRLRGYVSDRFLARLGWWATAEWRYRFYEYADSTMGLSAVLFADVGQVGEEPEDLIVTPIPWSIGFALRAEQNLILLGRLQFAVSPDGFRFSIGLGELL